MLETFWSIEPDPWSKKSNNSKNFFSSINDVLNIKSNINEEKIAYLQQRLKNYLDWYESDKHKYIISNALKSYLETIKYSNISPKNHILYFEKDFKFLILKIWKDKKNLLKLYRFFELWRFFAPSTNPMFHQKQFEEMYQEIISIKI